MPHKRQKHPLPDDIREALNLRGLMDAYQSRPPYQQNDYIGTLCVTPARPTATKLKRLDPMPAELESGKFYTRIDWKKDGNS
jgi:hypothetical protein